MDKARKQNKKMIGNLYRRVFDRDMSKCAYCGAPREGLDHVPPLSVAVNLDLEKDKVKLFLYPCCSYCNGVLGNKRLYTYEERLIYLYNHTLRKIKDEEKQWSKEEIEELGPNLKQMIIQEKNKQVALQIKLKQYEEYICNMSPE